MTDERQDDLAALHAFGLLEGEERTAFLAEMAALPDLRRQVAELTLAASGLAHAAAPAEPPPALRARVLASAGRAGAAPAGNVVPFPRWVPWLAAAALAVAALWGFSQNRVTQRENERLRTDALAAVAALHRAEAELETEHNTAVATQAELAHAREMVAEAGRRVNQLSAQLRDQGDLAKLKIATLASMLGNSPTALAVAVWDPAREQGVLSVSKLPAAAAEKDYQLWVIDSHRPAPVSAGTFVVDPVTGEAHVVFRADQPVSAVAKFAVSLERKGGAPSPQGPIVLLSP